MFENSAKAIERDCQEKWKPLLLATLALCERCMRSPSEAIDHTFPHPWMELGPGYVYGPAFGHWDIVHSSFNLVRDDPDEAVRQLENDLSLLCDDGRLIGAIFFRNARREDNSIITHPPLWVFLADELFRLHGDTALLRTCLTALTKQIAWFERERQTEDGGFYYHDVHAKRLWECGVDESIRYKDLAPCVKACIDATAHVYALYDNAYRWSVILGCEQEEYKAKREALGEYIRTRMYNEGTGWFYDEFATTEERELVEAIDGAWPMVVGACNEEQARRVVEHLMSEELFFTEHPLAMVAISSPRFKPQMWQGCAFNSFTFWFAYGMYKNGFYAECKRVIERALDATARAYEETGKLWEFYHPEGLSPLAAARKPHTPFNTPCPDYIGHNPLLALYHLHEECCKRLQ